MQRTKLRHLDLLRRDLCRGHMVVLAQKREQARDELGVAELNSHVSRKAGEGRVPSRTSIRADPRLTASPYRG